MVLDLLLAASLLLTAWRSLYANDPLQAVGLFVAYGLLLALAWARLDALDVALAEAGIGAGLTGALLLGASRHAADRSFSDRIASPMMRAFLAAGALSLTSIVALALWSLRKPRGPGIAPLVSAKLSESGVKHPVTSVLLNFRSWDTLLEIGVLVVAAFSILALRLARSPPRKYDPMLAALVRVMVPILGVCGGYLLWAGSHRPGGAFQAGALLGAAGVLLQLAGYDLLADSARRGFRALLVVGFGTFLCVGIGVSTLGHQILEYPPTQAGSLIFWIELVATISIAVTLNLLYAASGSGAT
ncbi:MAG: hypothetical protein A2428_01910 [Bdellovibrionales bacterium RIFOXYC1_FULL_54_43]|nr:MAG: hypothetical protein A2428_01910 [Bdellovibrionales bacterium RIFOXYC1_FULL_54_43]OFZ81694.1 MAG: hypothetical protein A2603_12120 [Bdellovibrionales bacterium RIFOXYD1_FULL_55_31]